MQTVAHHAARRVVLQSANALRNIACWSSYGAITAWQQHTGGLESLRCVYLNVTLSTSFVFPMANYYQFLLDSWRPAYLTSIYLVARTAKLQSAECECVHEPPSSASIERVFSSFGAIHTKVRNGLGNGKASKLVFCYRMLRGRKELE